VKVLITSVNYIIILVIFRLIITRLCYVFELFVRPFGQIFSDHDISWTPLTILIKLTGNIQSFLRMTCLDSGGQSLKVKVTTGRRGGKDIHLDAGMSKFIFICVILRRLSLHKRFRNVTET